MLHRWLNVRHAVALHHLLCALQVTCLTVSPSGRYLASGQKTNMGFIADVIIWDLETRKQHQKLSLHKVMVQALAFSHDETLLATLGGPDDSSLIMWNVETGEAICGSPSHNNIVHTVQFLHTEKHRLVTGGQGMLGMRA
jgi:cilia- and flagella-associated protein 52